MANSALCVSIIAPIFLLYTLVHALFVFDYLVLTVVEVCDGVASAGKLLYYDQRCV